MSVEPAHAPTGRLRFVERQMYNEHTAETQSRRILQQQWVMPGNGETYWIDVPLEDET